MNTRQPSPQHLEGFFHGMQHALVLAEGRKRGALSAQSHAIRRELANLRLLNEEHVKITACKAWAREAPAKHGVSPLLTPAVAPSKYAPVLRKLATGALMLCISIVFMFAFMRAMSIEAYNQNCEYSRSC
jgi:hypothetical protein